MKVARKLACHIIHISLKFLASCRVREEGLGKLLSFSLVEVIVREVGRSPLLSGLRGSNGGRVAPARAVIAKVAIGPGLASK